MQASLIPQKVQTLKPYGFEDTCGCTVKADANESFVALPDDLRAKLAEIAQNALYNRYPDPLSCDACAAYGAYVGVDSRYITAGNGSDELIMIIINSLMERGDKLLVAEPDFSMYRFYANLAEIGVIDMGKDSDYCLSAKALCEAAETQKPKAIMFSNPCSPTGQALSREEVLACVDAHPEVLWIVDEAYMDFWNEPVIADALTRDNMIVLRTCSKAVGMAAIRLGFAICGDALTEALRKAKSPANVNALTNAMAATVLSDRSYLRGACMRIRQATSRLYAGLKAAEEAYGVIRALPTKANFVFVETADAVGLQEYLKQNAILVRRLGTRLRITACGELDNEAIISAVTAYCATAAKGE
ncbi:MAG: histidinol-phosphate aminotransferase family protein [Clostridia bacterium]|nr:histidinol-phosphate aminotransferase family protein [Clostridia bacterium]